MAPRRIPGFCALCRSRCGCISVVEDGRLLSVEPDPTHPTGSALCIKGRAAPELVHSNDRLLRPLKRTRPKGEADAGWEPISWEEALDWTAAQMRRVRDELGPESVAFAVTSPSGTAISDAIVWIQRLVRIFGSPNIANSTEICNWHKDFATAYTFGVGIPAPDFENAGCILLWGHNPANTWLAHATLAAAGRRRGARLIVVDPRAAGLAKQADEWLRVRPGSDGALALGIASCLIANGWYDREFVRDWTTAPFLIREDTGHFLTPADLGPGGPREGRVSWDLASHGPVVWDTPRRRYESCDRHG
jgi:anaerobic selenocysteine-containing dehydrogenase